MYDTILLPTDGSRGSEAALEHVRTLASTFDATVHVLYVADNENEHSHYVMTGEQESFGTVGHDEVVQESGMTQQSSTAMERLIAAGERLVESTADSLDEAGLSTVTEVRRGNPYRTILEYADEEGVDLVVMPTHGRRGVDRLLLGSVTEKAVRGADVPVMTVRLSEE